MKQLWDASRAGKDEMSAIDKAVRGREAVSLNDDECVGHQWRWAGDMRICLRCRLGITRKERER